MELTENHYDVIVIMKTFLQEMLHFRLLQQFSVKHYMLVTYMSKMFEYLVLLKMFTLEHIPVTEANII